MGDADLGRKMWGFSFKPIKFEMSLKYPIGDVKETVCLFFFFFSWATPAAYGGSQARGRIGAVVSGLRQSHSNAGSEPRLQPTPQLTATPDP